ncbi:hypothetical protein V6U81_20510 [Micromonospora sp. CPCC 205711]|uniref:hypothetical protein n=1 Tax=Micromonospora sp. CPCC 205547 TaxID=3122400 RepID=UPI002FF250E1
MSQSSKWTWAALVVALVAAGVVVDAVSRPDDSNSIAAPVVEAGRPGPVSADSAELTYTRLAGPDRTQVRDASGRVLAVFTDGARTVRISGPRRTFTDPRFTRASVTTDAWIRLAPRTWREGSEKAPWFRPWLDGALRNLGRDALAISMDYLDGVPSRTDPKGRRFAGDASFGPLDAADPDGRAEDSDFHDYLGVEWDFPDSGPARPAAGRLGSLDSSGLIRMVYGHRMGCLLRGTDTRGPGLPRHAFAIAGFGPGAVLVPNTGRAVRDYGVLQEGDLVFFNDGGSAGTAITRSGIYLGVDDTGHHRFLSSQAKADGPTFGGDSVLDGSVWSGRFLTARRI